jgi:hypothetical protein
VLDPLKRPHSKLDGIANARLERWSDFPMTENAPEIVLASEGS